MRDKDAFNIKWNANTNTYNVDTTQNINIEQMAMGFRLNMNLYKLKDQRNYIALVNKKAEDTSQCMSSNVPRPNYQANNSTASLISIDVPSVISILGKNRTPQTKLQQKLIKEEEERFLENTFSKRKIQGLTGLDGDSLQTFMQLCRQNINTAKNMSEYEIIMHIKKSYHEYIEK